MGPDRQRSRLIQQRPVSVRAARLAVALLLTAIAVAVRVGAAGATPAPTYHTNSQRGRIVFLGDAVPHATGVMVDQRIVPDLTYLAQTYPIYVEEGYAGPLKGVGEVGCRECHVAHSDHYNGLAVDIVPLGWDGKGCDSSWRPITRLAHWAEPHQNHPRLPFRWVGYNGDVDHGCGNHLHLSWNHAPAKRFTIARWVTVFDVPPQPVEPIPPTTTPPPTTPVPPTSTGREATAEF